MSEWDLAPLVPVVISIAGAVGGAYYARKKGLPEIQYQADQAAERLIEALKDQLALANAEIAKLRPQLTAAETRITALEHEVERLESRAVRLFIRIDELERRTK